MSIADQIIAMEKGLARLSKHVPNLPAQEVQATRMLIFLGRQLMARTEQRLREFGLTEPEYHALLLTFAHSQDNEVTSPSELCGSLTQSPANMTRLIDTLVQRNLITREPDGQDRRKLVLRTTAQGDALVNQLLPRSHAALRSIFGQLPGEDTQNLVSLLKRLATVLDAHISEQGNDSCAESDI